MNDTIEVEGVVSTTEPPQFELPPDPEITNVDNERIEKKKTWQLSLTKADLIHLRDLFSVMSPHAPEETVSSMLAELSGSSFSEEILWGKVTKLLEDAGIVYGDEAPDYVVVPVAAPRLTVMRVVDDPHEG